MFVVITVSLIWVLKPYFYVSCNDIGAISILFIFIIN